MLLNPDLIFKLYSIIYLPFRARWHERFIDECYDRRHDVHNLILFLLYLVVTYKTSVGFIRPFDVDNGQDILQHPL